MAREYGCSRSPVTGHPVTGPAVREPFPFNENLTPDGKHLNLFLVSRFIHIFLSRFLRENLHYELKLLRKSANTKQKEGHMSQISA